LYLTIAVPMASDGSGGNLRPIVGESTVRDGDELGSVRELVPFFTFFLKLSNSDTDFFSFLT